MGVGNGDASAPVSRPLTPLLWLDQPGKLLRESSIFEPPIPQGDLMKRHNPERRAWKGKSYKKGGKRVLALRLKAKEKAAAKES